MGAPRIRAQGWTRSGRGVMTRDYADGAGARARVRRPPGRAGWGGGRKARTDGALARCNLAPPMIQVAATGLGDADRHRRPFVPPRSKVGEGGAVGEMGSGDGARLWLTAPVCPKPCWRRRGWSTSTLVRPLDTQTADSKDATKHPPPLRLHFPISARDLLLAASRFGGGASRRKKAHGRVFPPEKAEAVYRGSKQGTNREVLRGRL